MNIKRILIPLLSILFMASMIAFGAPVYVNIGPTSEIDGDIKILSEIVAEGTTADGWETTIFFTDPTADRTITIPDFDVTAGTAIYLTVTDNENTNETNAVLFTSGGALGGGVLGIESDGDFYYNPSDGSIHAVYLYGDGSNITNIGAASASALTFTGKEENTGNIVKGQAVYISGAAGAAFPLVGLADCDDANKIRIIGLAAEAIAQNTSGLVRRSGLLSGVDTLGANAVNPNDEAWAAGDLLYVDDTAGGLTNVKPTSGRVIKAAYTLYGSSNTDDLLVVTHENPVYIACAAGEDIDLRMGDIAAANKVLFQDYANNVVGYVDSDGKADFTSLTLDTALIDAEIASAATWNAKAASGANTDITSILNAALYVGRDLDNRISWATDDRLIIEIANVIHTFLNIETGIADNDSLVTQGYVDDAAAGGGANVALSNLAAVAINTSLLSDAADTDNLGSATKEWLNLYLGTYGTVYFGTGQTENIAETAINELTITATTVAISGTLTMGANNITTTGYIGRDADNYISWDTDNTLKIEINNILHSIVSITDGVANNDKLATQGYVDDQVAGTNVNLSNLAAVAINTTLISDAADTDSLGSVDKEWLNLYIGEAGKIYLRLDQSVNLQATGAGILTITAANGVVTSAGLTVGGTLALAANSITMTGSIGVTGSRITKVWTAALESTADITINGTALAAIYANLGANTNITSLTNAALTIGRDADNEIDFATDNIIQFRTSGADCVSIGTAGEIDLQQFYILLDDALGTDHDYSGLVDSAAVGENVVFGDLLYFDWTAVEWKKAKADVIGTTPAQRIALESKADGQTCLMLVQGYIRDDSAFDFGASRIFLNDDVAGTCDDTAPAESGDQIQVVGIAISADKMYFNPSIDVGEI